MKDLKILVVDDDPTSLLLVARGLAQADYPVKTAADGSDAVRCIDEELFDVVITDLMMPGVDGIGVLDAAKARSGRTEVLLLTAHGSIETAVKAMRKGATDYLQKPTNLHELLIRLEKIASFRKVAGMADQLREAMDVTERNAGQTIQDLEMEVTRLRSLLSKAGEALSNANMDDAECIESAFQILDRAEVCA
jgi:DNA-binding NtrC family response regulator